MHERRTTRRLARRRFLKSAVAGSIALSLPRSAHSAMQKLKHPVSMGLIADLHQDVMHDGAKRMQAFVRKMSVSAPHAILQLGDFAYPNAKNAEVISMFNDASAMPLHVIGNHDTDAGHTKQQCLEVWKMPARYYVQNIRGLNLIVLDGNDKGSPTYTGGYHSFVGEEQTTWLKKQLADLQGPIIVACHQPLAGPWAVDNAKQVQAILGAASDKVILSINGHSHIDNVLQVKGVTYLHVNSASYQWVGREHQHTSYAREVHDKFKSIKYTCPYRDSLFATLTVAPKI